MLHTDADYWLDRASEVLLLAADTHEEWSRWRMIQIAVAYNRLAINLQKRAEKNSEPVGRDQTSAPSAIAR
jgi:hypothetical protein